MAHSKNRQCLHCHTLFVPDYRNRDRQKFCHQPACKEASKTASQKQWAAKNPSYFNHPENVQRVQEWRLVNPGYWKGKAKRGALQDICSPEIQQKQEDITKLSPANQDPAVALQDSWIIQPTVLIGLIAQITGLALQDDIAEVTRRLAQLGQDVLNRSTLTPTGGHHDSQVPNLPRPHSQHPRTVQLAGSPAGP